MKNWSILFALTAVLTTGCKPPPKEQPKAKAGSGSTKAAPAPSVFRYARTSAHKSLDPMRQFDGASGELVQNLYDGLLQYHYLKRPYVLEPNLVTQMPTLSEDGLTYTWELRDDVYFVDNPCFKDGKGRRVTTDDVIYSLKRFADANVNTTSYHVLLKGVVVGLDEFRAATQEKGKGVDYSTIAVSGIKKIDDRRFTITLTKENPLAIMPFAVAALSILPKEAVDKYGVDFQHNPVGTGPYIMANYERRGVLVLKKNPKYHGRYPTEGAPGDKEAGFLADAGKPLPLIDEIRLPLVEEAQPRMIKFKKGLLDWIGLDKTNFTKMARLSPKGMELKPEYAKKYRFYSAKGLDSSYFIFNLKDGLVGKNKALRQAFAYAINVPDFIEKMLNGRGTKLNSIVPHEIAGNENDTGVSGYEYNVDKAKAKLVEAGYPEGKGFPPLVIEFAGTTKSSRDMGEYFRIQLAKVGIKAEPNYQEFSAYLRKVDAANFQVAWGAWAADYPDPENFFQLFYGPNKAPGPNHGSYVNPDYDKLYEEIRFMPNGPERYSRLKKMAEILNQDVPAALTYSSIRFGLYQPWVKNLKRNLMADMPLKYYGIDASAKKTP